MTTFDQEYHYRQSCFLCEESIPEDQEHKETFLIDGSEEDFYFCSEYHADLYKREYLKRCENCGTWTDRIYSIDYEACYHCLLEYSEEIIKDLLSSLKINQKVNCPFG